MSAFKIETKLQDEIFNKIGLYLDKPISSKATKQIMQQLNHPSSPKERIFNLLLTKFRGQFILSMLQNYPYLVGDPQSLSSTFGNLQKNIMKYEQEILKQLWKLLTKIIYINDKRSANQNQEIIYKYSYEELLKEGIKVTNLQKKNSIFGLIDENVRLFWDMGLKDNLRKVIGTYVQMFRRFPVTVPNYVKVLGQIIKLIQESNASKQQEENSQQQVVKLQKLPEISEDYLTQITQQLTNILSSTKDKPLHQLHNQTLVTIQRIITYKGKQFLKSDLTLMLTRILDVYLFRKATREQARKVSMALTKISDYIDFANRQKMVREYSESNVSDKINQKPVLIENVISKTNQFLAKYQVNNLVGNMNQKQEQSDFVMRNSRFLKKNQGKGGGKAILEIQLNNQGRSKNKQLTKESGKKKDRFESLLQNCLQKCEWEKNEKNAFVKVDETQDEKFAVFFTQKQKLKPVKQQQREEKKKHAFQQEYTQFDQSIQSYFYDQQNENQQYQENRLNSKAKEGHNFTSTEVSYVSEEEVNEINELIDLAYSYKFSIH